MKSPKQLAKAAYLRSTYGKFDLIHDLIPKELLLKGKPRRVREWITQHLQIQEKDINANTLRSWLYRLRDKGSKNISEVDKNSWQDFKPSQISSGDIDEKIMIKKITTPIK